MSKGVVCVVLGRGEGKGVVGGGALEGRWSSDNNYKSLDGYIVYYCRYCLNSCRGLHSK